MESRRSFFKKALTALGVGVVVLKSGMAFAKKLALSLDKVPALKEVGGSARVKLNGQEILLIRDGQNSVHGVSPKCTHQACYVAYNHKDGKIECPCHSSSFDLSGKVLGGPAPKPLPTYPVKLDKERLIISVD